MKEFTLVINHSTAHTVTTNALSEVLWRDMQENTQVIKPFSCSHCDYKCTFMSALKVHKRIHTGDKPFKCSHCEYNCTNKSSLKRHERTHTGEKPICCSQCDYKCSQLSSLKAHERTHSSDTSSCCSKCGKMFKRFGQNLRKHELKCFIKGFNSQVSFLQEIKTEHN